MAAGIGGGSGVRSDVLFVACFGNQGVGDISNTSGKRLPEIQVVLINLESCKCFIGITSLASPEYQTAVVTAIRPISVCQRITESTDWIIDQELAALPGYATRWSCLPKSLEARLT